MEIFKIIQYAGLISWVISCVFVAFVGVKYQIRHGIVKASVEKIESKDKYLLKVALVVFILGLLLILIGAIFDK